MLASRPASYEPANGHIVSLGSGHSYRNLRGLLAGYDRYRELGGSRPLFLGGTPGSRQMQSEVESAAARLPDVRLHWGGLPRDQFLAVLRDAAVVVLPSLVEASPLSALEACVLNPRVLMSDIIGHREILTPFSQTSRADEDRHFFSPSDADSLARRLLAVESEEGPGPWHPVLSSADARVEARERWADAVCGWLDSVSDVVARG